MITLEVHNQLVTWSADFAETMMNYYRSHGIPFKVLENGTLSRLNSVQDYVSLAKKARPAKLSDNLLQFRIFEFLGLMG
jgi:hypothetical protein